MESKVTLCPFCDREQTISRDTETARCESCGKVFSNDTQEHSHPHEFWSNPDNCAGF